MQTIESILEILAWKNGLDCSGEQWVREGLARLRDYELSALYLALCRRIDRGYADGWNDCANKNGGEPCDAD